MNTIASIVIKLVRGSTLLLVIAAFAGCGSAAGHGSRTATEPDPAVRVLSAPQTKQLLLQLPYHFHWREVELPKGATGGVAGAVIGRHQTIVHFGISLGTEPEPLPVPNAGISNTYYYYGGGFVFTDDTLVQGKEGSVQPGRQFHTASQWRESGNMVVRMQEKLCRAATGKACQE